MLVFSPAISAHIVICFGRRGCFLFFFFIVFFNFVGNEQMVEQEEEIQ